MIFTSECVTAGHPDKLCDHIADSFVDEALRQDPDSHMAVEVSIKDNVVMVFGEAGTKAKIDYAGIARKVLKETGYPEDFEVEMHVQHQSPEINNAVRRKDGEIGAGDQGIIFGYANNETPEYLGAAFYYARQLAVELGKLEHSDPRLGPDGKTQVSVEYDDQGKVKRVTTVIVSTMHKKDVTQEELRAFLTEDLVKKVIPAELLDEETRILINPSGSFVVGGPFGDSGTTGRKIVADTYGGYGRVGGGCLSSKDPSKVDRSAAYYTRYAAKSIVANGLADRCEIEVGYAIGYPKPVSVYVNAFGTNKVPQKQLEEIVQKNFDFSVRNIIDELNLRQPVYAESSCYGQFGNPSYPWEKIKKIEF